MPHDVHYFLADDFQSVFSKNRRLLSPVPHPGVTCGRVISRLMNAGVNAPPIGTDALGCRCHAPRLYSDDIPISPSFVFLMKICWPVFDAGSLEDVLEATRRGPILMTYLYRLLLTFWWSFASQSSLLAAKKPCAAVLLWCRGTCNAFFCLYWWYVAGH